MIATDSIPEELRTLNQWCVWRLVSGKKLPFQVNGKPAKADDASTFTSFDAVKGQSMIGLFFAEDDPLCGIDMDGCLGKDERGKLVPKEWAKPIFARFKGKAYAEISPSGSGVKLWIHATKPDGSPCKLVTLGQHEGIEAYDSGRYFAVTGRCLGDGWREIHDAQPEIEWLIEYCQSLEQDSDPEQHIALKSNEALPRSEQARLDKIIEQGRHFETSEVVQRAIKYLDKMEESTSGYQGHDCLLRAASAMRTDFDLSDEQSIYLLVSRFNPRCQPPWKLTEIQHKVSEASKNKMQKEPGRLRTKKVSNLSHEQQRTELEASRRFVREHGANIRFVSKWRKWLHWSGSRWRLDEMGIIHGLAKETIDRLWGDVGNQIKRGDETKSVVQFVKSMSTSRGIAAMLALASTEMGIAITHDDLDLDPLLLGCDNGVVDLRDGSFRAGQQSDYVTMTTGHDFDANAACPTWMDFLQSTFGDQNLIDYLHALCGYFLTGLTDTHILPILFGSGSNGKSTFLNALMYTLGDYAIVANPLLLLEGGNNQHPTIYATLYRRRLVVASESPEGAKLNETLVKRLTGGDVISCRRMKEDEWNFSPSHKLILATNHRPAVRGTDHAIWGRLALVPFEQFFNQTKADRGLPAKLKAEAPGILNWVIQGCWVYRMMGLEPPPAVQSATSEYRASEDTFGDWLQESCERTKDCREKASKLLESFNRFAECRNEKKFTAVMLADRLKQAGFEKIQSNGIQYLGLRLKTDFD